jgi:hypothetical protein
MDDVLIFFNVLSRRVETKVVRVFNIGAASIKLKKFVLRLPEELFILLGRLVVHFSSFSLNAQGIGEKAHCPTCS